MDNGRIVVVFRWHKRKQDTDIDIPLDISANELIVALNKAFGLGMDISDLSRCHLKAENPVQLLRGNRLLRDFRLRKGSIINFTQ